jgi:AcrR family transcriptional regulator
MSTHAKPLRRDARQNREKLIAAATGMFAERGLDVPLEEIARRAGVSIGTLYNRFPTREALIEEVFTDQISAQLVAGEQALACDDPWEGFAGYVERLCELQAQSRGLTDVMSMRFAEAGRLTEACERGLAQAAGLIARAQEHSVLRADFTSQDLVCIIWANARILEATATVAPRVWRRNLAFYLDGLRAEAAHPVAEPPLSPDQLEQAMLRLAR